MDGSALATIGLAANILQFIDWVSHVCDVGSQIRRNGMSDFNLDLDRTSAELKHQLQRIRPPPGTITCATRAEQSLRRIADQRASIADELLLLRQSFSGGTRKAQDAEDSHKLRPGQKIRTPSQALRLEWNKDQIESLSQKLNRYRELLDTEILLDIRETTLLSAQNGAAAHTTTLLVHRETLPALGQTNMNTEALLHKQSNLA
ncbi:hypothetical protein DL95DRAFT_92377 [Leptodontidium sp. 2 PMI_412]|nr:hypothetical protein DL95DRAFT_92377 [Leptodontidium sp. 2 PMI_412]